MYVAKLKLSTTLLAVRGAKHICETPDRAFVRFRLAGNLSPTLPALAGH